jgi:LysR family transcriptional activator of nhaA
MEWLNYHHLLYFWLVAREGSLARASAELRLAPSTVSGQIRALEQSLGEKLFVKRGRRLALSDTGRIVFSYAEQIFSLGRDLQDTLKNPPAGRPLRVTVGIADVIPKLVARKLLEPALRLPGAVRLICREDRPERLLADLALHELDVILTDVPAYPQVRVKAFSHVLGESEIVLLARPDLAAAHRGKFPSSLDGAPLLLPTENTTLRRSLDEWFESNRVRPRVVAEFEDSALLTVFGLHGLGLFPAASVIVDDVKRQGRVEVVGTAKGARERYYAVTVERHVKHPAVVAICEEARQTLA